MILLVVIVTIRLILDDDDNDDLGNDYGIQTLCKMYDDDDSVSVPVMPLLAVVA